MAVSSRTEQSEIADPSDCLWPKPAARLLESRLAGNDPKETVEVMRVLGAILGLGFVFVGCFILFGGLDGWLLRWITGPLSVTVGAYFLFWGLNKNSFRT